MCVMSSLVVRHVAAVCNELVHKLLKPLPHILYYLLDLDFRLIFIFNRTLRLEIRSNIILFGRIRSSFPFILGTSLQDDIVLGLIYSQFC